MYPTGYTSLSRFQKRDVRLHWHEKSLDTSACWCAFLNRWHQRVRLLVSQLEYGEGSGNAAKEDQSEADELENAHMRAVARRLERNTHYEEEGGPQWDCP